MRPGRPFKFKDYDNVYCEGGVVDRFNFKSIFFTIKTTAKCLEEENKMRHLKHLHYNVRQTINKHSDKELFKKTFLSNPTIHETYDETGKAFTQFDYTLFLEKTANFLEIEKEVNKIIDRIYLENFRDNKSFEFIKHNIKMLREKRKANVEGNKKQHFSKDILW
jgi:hypothetical protein